MGRHYLPVTVNAWVEFVRRVRLNKTVKAVALMMATYARRDGTQIYPGIATLAVACEMSYRTVLNAVSDLQRLGLVEQVADHGGAMGRYDSYRLTLAEDLIDIDVLSPEEFKDLAAGMRQKYRGKHRPQPVDNSQTRVVPQHASGAGDDERRVSFDDADDTRRMSSDGERRVSFDAGGSKNKNLPAKDMNLHVKPAAEILGSNLTVVGLSTDPILICDQDGCAKGWILTDEAIARCPRCNVLSGVA